MARIEKMLQGVTGGERNVRRVRRRVKEDPNSKSVLYDLKQQILEERLQNSALRRTYKEQIEEERQEVRQLQHHLNKLMHRENPPLSPIQAYDKSRKSRAKMYKELKTESSVPRGMRRQSPILPETFKMIKKYELAVKKLNEPSIIRAEDLYASQEFERKVK